MYSLQNYKDQCYNIGSPSPTPAKSPVKRLPKTIDTQFAFTPIKSQVRLTLLQQKFRGYLQQSQQGKGK